MKIIVQLLDGLAAVHARGIVHRDLKPGNVLFDTAGRAVLTDFGLARPESDEVLTSANAVLGTPSYMTPNRRPGSLTASARQPICIVLVSCCTRW
jgi:serine/threonine-protein kinase